MSRFSVLADLPLLPHQAASRDRHYHIEEAVRELLSDVTVDTYPMGIYDSCGCDFTWEGEGKHHPMCWGTYTYDNAGVIRRWTSTRMTCRPEAFYARESLHQKVRDLVRQVYRDGREFTRGQLVVNATNLRGGYANRLEFQPTTVWNVALVCIPPHV